MMKCKKCGYNGIELHDATPHLCPCCSVYDANTGEQ
jgi:predicted Zn-ribbon and HTH transcriptional regulator